MTRHYGSPGKLVERLLGHPSYTFAGGVLLAALIQQVSNVSLWWLFVGACVGIATAEIQRRLK